MLHLDRVERTGEQTSEDAKEAVVFPYPISEGTRSFRVSSITTTLVVRELVRTNVGRRYPEW